MNGQILLLASLAFMLAAILKFRHDLRKTQKGYEHVWRGIVQRGFAEAEKQQHLKRGCDHWILSDAARAAYRDIETDLHSLYLIQKCRLGREPSDEELAWAIEEKFQLWIVTHLCPKIGVNQHGCLAIALIIAREATP